ncbi:Ammonium transporter Rh type B [Orchesella cincta]|uniref:Ammonium transporter Rh type B n=1 Tax=Orchesella cincta TaxID=48709 RepID=A0A1D2MQB3_ORCCI|nr:Ammonium transporter Rh type B [Orchesella cincta]
MGVLPRSKTQSPIMIPDVHVMIFIGFGFLMTFLRKYGYSAVGYNLLIAAIAIQWSIICRGIFHHNEKGLIPVDITTLINGDFAAAAVLITFGAVLGVTSPFQLVSICLIEVFLYALNEYIGAELLKAIDVGGSMFIHTFGAYFGLALSLVLRKNSDSESKNEGASYTSDVFAMIGTVFLWMFWPSFNGAMAEGDDQHRAVINTVLSLTASCICTFAISALVSAENKFNMVHIQNATLAGGVAVGAVADLMIRPYGALIIGSLAGLLSTVGYTYITPFLQSKLNLHDTCGVNNLHGMPGIMSGLAGAVMAVIASESEYGIGLYKQYPAMAPEMNSSHLQELRKDLTSIEAGDGRTAGQQALYQLLALGVTLCIAIIGGAVTGLVMRLPLFGQVPDAHLFDDSKLWEVPEEDENSPENKKGETNQSFEMKSGKE